LVVVLVRKRDVAVQGVVSGVVVGDTVNGVVGDASIEEFIVIGTVLGDLGEKDLHEGVFIDVGVSQ
jgi:hypothetical protein